MMRCAVYHLSLKCVLLQSALRFYGVPVRQVGVCGAYSVDLLDALFHFCNQLLDEAIYRINDPLFPCRPRAVEYSMEATHDFAACPWWVQV